MRFRYSSFVSLIFCFVCSCTEERDAFPVPGKTSNSSSISPITSSTSTSSSSKDIPDCRLLKIITTWADVGLSDTTYSLRDTLTLEYSNNLLIRQTEKYTDQNGSHYFSSTEYHYTHGEIDYMNIGGLKFYWTNQNGHVTSISSPGYFTSAFKMSYDEHGRLVRWDGQNGAYTVFTYDENDNLKNFHEINPDVSPAPPVDFTYTYLSFDNKKNPYALAAKAMHQPYFWRNGFVQPLEEALSKNNHRKASVEANYSYYTYNSHDLPITYEDRINNFIVRIKFVYDNCLDF